MSVLDRVSRIVRANLNDLMARAEDPDKLLDQHIVEMDDSVREARRRVVDVIAQEKQTRRKVEEAEKDSQRWYERAETALRAGDEDLARRALGARLGVQREAEELTRQLGVQQEYTQTLKVSLEALEGKLTDAKAKRKEIAVARARRKAAGTARPRPDGPRPVDTAPLDDTARFDDFDRIGDQIISDDLEAQALADLDRDLSGGPDDADLERRFKELAKTQQADDDLAELKRKLDT